MQEKLNYENDALLIHLVNIFLKKRKLIFIGTIGFTILSILLIIITPKTFTSNSTLFVSTLDKVSAKNQNNITTGISVPIFTGYFDLMNNKEKYIDFLKYNNYTDLLSLPSPDFKKTIKPILAYDTGRRNVIRNNNYIVNLKLICKGDTAEKALKKASILGKYARATLLNLQIEDHFKNWKINLNSSITTSKLEINRLRRKIKELRIKKKFLTDRLLTMPFEDTTIGAQSMFNIGEKTEKYLSPQRQLIANTITMQDVEMHIEKKKTLMKIDQIVLSCIQALFNNFDIKNNYMVKENFLAELVKELKEFFQKKTGDENEEAFSLLKLSFYKFEKHRDIIYKYISGLEKNTFEFNKIKIVFFTFLLSLFFFFSLALSLEWWNNNKDNIT